MDIKKYLHSHIIIEIGSRLPGYLCTETIVDNFLELIDIICKSRYFISEIRWWHRIEIGDSSPIGYGGPRDPREPKTHYFAETYLEKNFSKYHNKEDYIIYLKEVQEKFKKLDLFPAFDIKETRDCSETWDG